MPKYEYKEVLLHKTNFANMLSVYANEGWRYVETMATRHEDGVVHPDYRRFVVLLEREVDEREEEGSETGEACS